VEERFDLPLTPFTWMTNLCTGRFGGGRDHVTVALSTPMAVRDTSGAAGTSTPRMLMSSETGFHSVCAVLLSSLSS
jgi:hypothetical protein